MSATGSSLWQRLRALGRRRRLEGDLEEELAFHLAQREEHYRRSGLAPGEARDAAARRFGNALRVKEDCREAWTFTGLERLVQDARLALRTLRRSPGFTVAALGSLALGIGANAAMFSLVSALLLRPLPYPDARRLVRLTGSYPKGAVAALQQRSRTMDVAGVGTEAEFNLTGAGGPVRVGGSVVSARLFSVLGCPPLLGRALEPGDEVPGRDRVVVLSHALWTRRFAADPRAVGRTLAVDGIGREVVGVMPPGFQFPSRSAELWLPLRMDPRQAEDYWGFGWMPAVARLRPGATTAQAHDELRSLVVDIAALFPWPARSWNMAAAVLPLQDDLVRDLRVRLLVLQAAVGLVLLVACANVASLLLSRAAARGREIALRSALGADRGRILRQLLTESVTLSLLGGGLGIALAQASLSGLQALLPLDRAGVGSEVAVDGGVLAFVTGLSVVSGLLFGVVPALSASKVDLAAAMKAGAARGGGPVGTRLRGAFIAAEVALAVVLTVGAGLLGRTLWRLARTDPGFRPEQTFAVRVTPNPSACVAQEACVALYGELVRRAAGLPGIVDAAAASAIPLHGEEPLLPLEMEGHPVGRGLPALLWAGAVTPEYLGLMRIPVLRGRGLEPSDGERSAPVVLLSAATAERYWPGQDPVGKHVRVMWDDYWRTVVGVVGDVRQYTLAGRAPAGINGALYMPYPQAVALDRRIPTAMTLLVRSSSDASTLAAQLGPLVSRLDPDAPTGEVRSLEGVVESALDDPRALAWLFAAFAASALLLAAIGTYGVVAYWTAQRSYEIGVRVAIGATRRDILGLVVGQSLRLVLAGLALGVLGAGGLARALAGFLYGVGPFDPATFAAVIGVMLVTGFLAGYLPGRRAAAADPVRALRTD